jgi:transcriptional regulator with XRE-family HTH domain
MENIAISLKTDCEAVGISLRALCKEAGVDKSIISRWAKDEPLTIRNLRKLQAVIDSKRAPAAQDDKDLADAKERSSARII